MKFYLRKIFKDTGWVLSLNSVNYASAFVIAVLVSRFLGVKELGDYTFIAALTSVMYLVADFGLTTLIVRKIGVDKSATLSVIKSAAVIKLSIGVVLFGGLIVYIVLTPAIVDSFGKDLQPQHILLLGTAAVFPRLLQANYESAIRVFGIQKYPTIIRSVNSLFQIGFGLWALSAGLQLLGVFSVILIFEMLTAIVFSVTNKIVLKKNGFLSPAGTRGQAPLHYGVKTLIRESSIFFLYNFLRFSMPVTVIFLVQYLRSSESVGIYSAAARFVGGIGLLTGAVFNSYYPLISNLAKDENLKLTLTRKLLGYSLAAGFVIVIVILSLSNALIDLTFKIQDSKAVLRILSFGILPTMVLPVIQSYMFSTHSEKFNLKILLLVWILNLFLTYLLVNFYDYSGAAISFVVCEYVLIGGLFLRIPQMPTTRGQALLL
jgi:O-antigen/teichoic acid export membrane protein